jgi:hypothetical protein
MGDAAIGGNAIRLALRSPLWVQRKLENIEFLDSFTARRTVRLDIDLACLDGWRDSSGQRDLDRWPLWRGGILVPLAILPRSFYTPVEISNATGELMPRLTKSEERNFAREGLLELAAQVAPLTPRMERITERLVIEEPVEDLQGYLDAQGDEGRIFKNDDSLLTAAAVLNTQYLLLTLIPGEVDRQVLTYSMIARLDNDTDGKSRPQKLTHLVTECLVPKPSLTVKIGLGDTPSGSDSYHVQASNPYDLVFTDSRLTYRRLNGTAPMEFTELDRDRLPNLGHVHLSGSRRVTDCSYHATLCHIPTGLVRSAPLSTLLTAGLLTAGTAWLWRVPAHDTSSVDAQVGAAVLLIVPALMGMLLVTPKYHTLTARVLFRSRFLLMATSLAPTVPAAAVALKWQGILQLGTWVGSAGIAWLATLYLGTQFLLARRWTRAKRPGRAHRA